ncbi:MAG: pyridoxamine 5'-phosphate oxidase family protein [Flavobacteriaceae bacterium]
MAQRFERLTKAHIEFIKKQKVFFVATGMGEGRINLSPKGMDTFKVLDPDRILWLNLTGSGNETATHLQYNDRMTIMFCAFEGKPLILRLYGSARAYHERDDFWKKNIHRFPEISGRRQLIELNIQLVQTSCGMAVPLMEFKQERDLLKIWAEKKGKKGLEDYYHQKNTTSLDGHPTGIFDNSK